MLVRPLSWARRNPAADLIRAAGDALARPEILDAMELRPRLAALAAAARDDELALFLPELVDAAPALYGYLQGFRIEDAAEDFLRTYCRDAFSRFLHTLELTPRPVSGPILEIGSNPYLFHLLLRAVFPDATLVGSNFFDHNVFSNEVGTAHHRLSNSLLGEAVDFEFPTFNLETAHPYPFGRGQFGIVYMCEVLEHLVVNPLRVFREIRRILRPGGYLLVTLPNALRITNVAAMVAGRNFFDFYHLDNGIHGRHNREFSLAEMRVLLERDGFEVVRAETRDRLDYDRVSIGAIDYSGPATALSHTKSGLERWLRWVGGISSDRGDNIYVVARVPEEAPACPNGDQTQSAVLQVLAESRGRERLVCYLDNIEPTVEGLRVVGWAFHSDDLSGRAGIVEMVVCHRRETRVFQAEHMSRPDVAAAHGLDHDDVGFIAAIPRDMTPPVPFEIRVRVQSGSGATAERVIAIWEERPVS